MLIIVAAGVVNDGAYKFVEGSVFAIIFHACHHLLLIGVLVEPDSLCYPGEGAAH